MSPRTLTLATRGSKLALAQSGRVAGMIEAVHPGVRVTLRQVVTSGDTTAGPLRDHGGKGLFVKEIEQALLRGEADVAVHSFKDVPVTMPLVEGAEHALTIAAVPARADVRDVLLSVAGGGLEELKQGAIVGTSSPRRRALLLDARPDLNVVELRGNVDTRLAKLAAGEIDAIVLARAGLERIGRHDEGSGGGGLLDPERFVPAAGQGALAVQCRAEDAEVRDLLAALDDAQSRCCVEAERRVVELLEGDCTSPIGAWATLDGEALQVRVAWHDGVALRRGVGSEPEAVVEGLRR